MRRKIVELVRFGDDVKSGRDARTKTLDMAVETSGGGWEEKWD